jgi:hypothetical protein
LGVEGEPVAAALRLPHNRDRFALAALPALERAAFLLEVGRRTRVLPSTWEFTCRLLVDSLAAKQVLIVLFAPDRVQAVADFFGSTSEAARLFSELLQARQHWPASLSERVTTVLVPDLAAARRLARCAP